MTLADELAQVNADLEHDDYPENGVTRSTIRRAVEALRAADRAEEWCRARLKALDGVDPENMVAFDDAIVYCCERVVKLMAERPSAAERSEDERV